MDAHIRNAYPQDIPLIRQLATEIWPIAYKDIITQDQVDYMLNLIYSEDALRYQVLEQKHQFILIYHKGMPAGYASYSVKSPDDTRVFRLNKLYVLTELHGHGLGKQMLEHITTHIKTLGATDLELNVNKNNPAIQFYKRFGFIISREEDLDIGNGYFMNDYIMTLLL